MFHNFSYKHTKQSSKNVANTTFKVEPQQEIAYENTHYNIHMQSNFQEMIDPEQIDFQ